ncbi:hypothetical protein FB451DRAFT_1261011, partial [Mycena latifolia]
EHLIPRDKYFLRAMVHNDYLRRRKNILLQQIIGICKTPSHIPSLLFDYTDPSKLGGVGAGVASISPRSPFTLSDARPRGAVIETQGVAAQFGREETMMIMPMRISSTGARYELWRIASEIPQGTNENQLEALFPDIYKRIQVLLGTRVEEFH